MTLRESLRRLVDSLRDNLTPSVDSVLANATREIERLEEVAAAKSRTADRLYDLRDEMERKAGDVLYEANRASRVAARFRELLD